MDYARRGVSVPHHTHNIVDKICTMIPASSTCVLFVDNLDLWIQVLTFITLVFSLFWWLKRFQIYAKIKCLFLKIIGLFKRD